MQVKHIISAYRILPLDTVLHKTCAAALLLFLFFFPSVLSPPEWYINSCVLDVCCIMTSCFTPRGLMVRGGDSENSPYLLSEGPESQPAAFHIESNTARSCQFELF